MKLPMKLAPLLAAAVLVATAPSGSALCVSTSGGCLGPDAVTDGINEATGIAGAAADEATGLAIAALGIALGVAEGQVQDLDHDGVPDAAEPVLCGNDLLYGTINQAAVPGDCTTRTDYLPPDNLAQALELAKFVSDTAQAAAEQAVATAQQQAEQVRQQADATVGFAEDRVNEAIVFVEGQADQTLSIVDADHDNVLDVLEPVICGFVENQNVEQDGSCTADNRDYTPWSP
jgi:hypothetical protein